MHRNCTGCAVCIAANTTTANSNNNGKPTPRSSPRFSPTNNNNNNIINDIPLLLPISPILTRSRSRELGISHHSGFNELSYNIRNAGSELRNRARKAKLQLEVSATNAGKYAYKLLKFENLPVWLQDNRHIKSGYRVDIGWRNSCHSMCHLHNETMNFWTHFIACLFMGCLLFFTMMTMSPFGVDRINLDIVHNIHTDTLNPNNIIVFHNHNQTDPFNHSINNLPDYSFIDNLYDTAANTTHHIYNRLNEHFQSIQKLTLTLRSQSSILDPLSSTAKQKFIEYLNKFENSIEEIKQSVSKASIQDIKNLFTDENNSNNNNKANANIIKHLASADSKQLDLVTLTKSMLQDFIKNFKQELKDKGEASELNELQTIEENTMFTAVKVKVKPLKGLGSGNPVAGLALVDINSNSNNSSSVNSIDSVYNNTLVDDELFQLHSFLPRYPLTIFMISAMCCLLFSSIFHLFQSVNGRIAVALQNLDYAGICLLISGSNVPIIYYGFYCAPYIKWTYIIVMLTLGGIGFIIAMHPTFRGVKYRTFKTLVFITLGLSGMGPLTHLLIHLQHIHFIFYYLIVMGACYISGAIIYLLQVPERYFPGRFDIWMASHQLWHIAIFIAVLIHYLGLMHMYEWRMMRVCTI